VTATPEPRLLVVDDEPNVLELLAESLRYAGFAVETAPTGADALAKVESTRPDLLVLDVVLPDLTGFEVARRLRAGGVDAPVLFLTARDTVDNGTTGPALGGDDYVTKPFSLQEVIARIRALLRRSGVAAGADAPTTLTFGDIELDEPGHEVLKAGRPVSLSPTEFRLLRYLMQNAGSVLTRAQILERVWQQDFAGDYGVVESYVSYLRRKIDTTEPRLLHTVRGVGYVLRRPR
jgi:two-component system OmpR family response regulator